MSKPQLYDDKYVKSITEQINKSHPHYENTTTDMGAEYFANNDPLVPTDDRRYYQGHTKYDGAKDDYKLDDNIDKYKKSDGVFESKKHDTHSEKRHDTHSEKRRDTHSEKRRDTHSERRHDSESDKRKDTSHDSDKKRDSSRYDENDESTWTKEETYLKKLEMLRKLGELKEAGVKLSQNYSINSDYKMMKYEYGLHKDIRSKHNTVSWMSNMMVGIIQGIELLNDTVDPFGFKFHNSWSNDIRTNINNYYDVLGEICEKYTPPGHSISPELRLFFMLTSSAVMIQGHKIIADYTSSFGTDAKQINDDPVLVSDLRKKALHDESVIRTNNINAHIEKEHNIALTNAKNLQSINDAHKEYKAAHDMATTSAVERLNNNLIFTENISVASLNNDTEILRQKEKQKQHELILKNKQLESMNQMLQNMRNEEKITDGYKYKSKIQQLKGLSASSHSKHRQESDSDLSMDSASTMKINPNIKSIMAKTASHIVQTNSDSSKVSSDSSDSSSSKHSNSSSSKKSNSSSNSGINIKMPDLSRLNRPMPKTIDIESISIGNKSNDSYTGTKRGRPRKNIHLGH
jgi:hypothetical protein